MQKRSRPILPSRSAPYREPRRRDWVRRRIRQEIRRKIRTRLRSDIFAYRKTRELRRSRRKWRTYCCSEASRRDSCAHPRAERGTLLMSGTRINSRRGSIGINQAPSFFSKEQTFQGFIPTLTSFVRLPNEENITKIPKKY